MSKAFESGRNQAFRSHEDGLNNDPSDDNEQFSSPLVNQIRTWTLGCNDDDVNRSSQCHDEFRHDLLEWHVVWKDGEEDGDRKKCQTFWKRTNVSPSGSLEQNESFWVSVEVTYSDWLTNSRFELSKAELSKFEYSVKRRSRRTRWWRWGCRERLFQLSNSPLQFPHWTSSDLVPWSYFLC